jgi:hypothetical protein
MPTGRFDQRVVWQKLWSRGSLHRLKGNRNEDQTIETNWEQGGEKQKASAVASSPFLIPIEHQEDLQAKSAELPVLKVPESPKQGEHTTFNGIFERLSGAQRFGKGLKLSYSEVDLI